MIGTNCISFECRKDVALAGILRVVQEVLHRQRQMDPAASSMTVLSGLLPRGRDGFVPRTQKGQVKWINERLECFVKSLADQSLIYSSSERVFWHPNTTDAADLSKMPDGLHPSQHGVKEWSKAVLLPLFYSLLNKHSDENKTEEIQAGPSQTRNETTVDDKEKDGDRGDNNNSSSSSSTNPDAGIEQNDG